MIAAIKTALPLRAYLDELGVVFNLRGKALCPVHADKRPSLSLYRAKNGYERAHCFSCGFDADVIGAAQALQGLDFKGALKLLAERAGIKRGPLTPSEAMQAKKARQERQEKTALISAFRAWERQTVNETAELLRTLRQVIASKKPPLREAELEALAVLQGAVAEAEYFYDALCGRDDEKKYALFKEGNYAGF